VSAFEKWLKLARIRLECVARGRNIGQLKQITDLTAPD